MGNSCSNHNERKIRNEFKKMINMHKNISVSHGIVDLDYTTLNVSEFEEQILKEELRNNQLKGILNHKPYINFKNLLIIDMHTNSDFITQILEDLYIHVAKHPNDYVNALHVEKFVKLSDTIIVKYTFIYHSGFNYIIVPNEINIAKNNEKMIDIVFHYNIDKNIYLFKKYEAIRYNNFSNFLITCTKCDYENLYFNSFHCCVCKTNMYDKCECKKVSLDVDSECIICTENISQNEFVYRVDCNLEFICKKCCKKLIECPLCRNKEISHFTHLKNQIK
jgi:hypothetical protein